MRASRACRPSTVFDSPETKMHDGKMVKVTVVQHLLTFFSTARGRNRAVVTMEWDVRCLSISDATEPWLDPVEVFVEH